MPSNRPGREAGQAAAEFALVLPLLLVVVLAVVQVALLGRDQLVLVQASRAGAREAAVTADDGAVGEAVRGAAVGLDPALIALEIVRSGAQGDPVTVAVRYPAPIRVPFLGWLLTSSVDLSASAVARQEFA